jgi:putative ABC transport system ATP-binding protein
MGLAVHCKDLRKTYGEGPAKVEALRGVDLDVNEGELLMLMGPSGSGKTTLISIISGILSKTSGECKLGGFDLGAMSPTELTRFRGQKIGFVFQTFNLIPMLTCTENVAIPLILNGMDREEAEKKAKQKLADVGLSDKADTTPDQLSGGQQQRVAIARGVIHEPDLIVCDEPTSALDHETGMKIMQILHSLVKNRKKTLIVVTHDARIMEFADRIAKIEDGHIV